MGKKESVSPEWLEWVEYQSSMLRRELKLNRLDTLDPYELAEKIGFIKLISLKAIKNIPSEILQQLLVRDPGGWSAGSLIFPNGNVMVIMNPKHSQKRARVTLMEEIAHIHLAHKPSLLIPGRDGITTRTYDNQQEKEAYWVGAASLVPIGQLKSAQQLGRTVKELATYCEVSRKLITFRADTTSIKLVA